MKYMQLCICTISIYLTKNVAKLLLFITMYLDCLVHREFMQNFRIICACLLFIF
jgi:hypothetical protein